MYTPYLITHGVRCSCRPVCWTGVGRSGCFRAFQLVRFVDRGLYFYVWRVYLYLYFRYLIFRKWRRGCSFILPPFVGLL